MVEKFRMVLNSLTLITLQHSTQLSTHLAFSTHGIVQCSLVIILSVSLVILTLGNVYNDNPIWLIIAWIIVYDEIKYCCDHVQQCVEAMKLWQSDLHTGRNNHIWISLTLST